MPNAHRQSALHTARPKPRLTPGTGVWIDRTTDGAGDWMPGQINSWNGLTGRYHVTMHDRPSQPFFATEARIQIRYAGETAPGQFRGPV